MSQERVLEPQVPLVARPDLVPVDLEAGRDIRSKLISRNIFKALEDVTEGPILHGSLRDLETVLVNTGRPTAVVDDAGSKYLGIVADAILGNHASPRTDITALLESMRGLESIDTPNLKRYSHLIPLSVLGKLGHARDFAQARTYRDPEGEVMAIASILLAARELMFQGEVEPVYRMPEKRDGGTVRLPEPSEYVSVMAELIPVAGLVWVNPYSTGEHPDLVHGFLETLARNDNLPETSESHGRRVREVPERIGNFTMGRAHVLRQVVKRFQETGRDDSVLGVWVAELDTRERKKLLRRSGGPVLQLFGSKGEVLAFIFSTPSGLKKIRGGLNLI